MGQQSLSGQALQERFMTSGSGEPPAEWKREAQVKLQARIADTALIVDLATTQKSARLQAIFLTKLEEALMFGNKAIFSEEN